MIMNPYGLKFKTTLGVILFVVFFYRHPHGNVDAFLNHINMIVESIHCEHKYCVLLGDFNLDLLKFESHPDTDLFF